MSELNQIDTCEVCDNKNLKPVLNLGKHPMCDDLLKVTDERACEEYPIEILYCNNCMTAHQKYQVPKNTLFPITYHYRSRFTADVLLGMERLVSSCQEKFGSLTGSVVLDVGCNDGSLLDYFRKSGAKTIGIEPTGASQDAIKKGHITYSDYLSADLAQEIIASHGSPDIITFTNVFAHIEDLKGVLKALEILKTENTKIVIENHYLGSVLDGNQFDTFYHEHPRTYSFNSFVKMANSLKVDLEAVEFPSRYGGNIRVFMGINSGLVPEIDIQKLNEKEAQFEERFMLLNDNIHKWVEEKKSVINNEVKKYGALKGKAFPGRAAILIKLLELDETQIEAIYEKPGSMKINHFVPGTRIPIISDDDLVLPLKEGVPILNLAWHISEEINKYLNSLGHTGKIIDILSPEDF
jgi:hypothetical protein